jgi:flagellar biosynthesis/type III secretory pathway protein FliH
MLPRVMTRQFKPVRFFVLIGVAAFVVCGVAVLYTHRTAHGATVEERAAYESGEKAGEKAPPGATLPTDAEVNMIAQKYFEQQGSGEQLRNPTRAGSLEACKQAFEKGYTAGFKKTHPQQ